MSELCHEPYLQYHALSDETKDEADIWWTTWPALIFSHEGKSLRINTYDNYEKFKYHLDKFANYLKDEFVKTDAIIRLNMKQNDTIILEVEQNGSFIQIAMDFRSHDIQENLVKQIFNHVIAQFPLESVTILYQYGVKEIKDASNVIVAVITSVDTELKSISLSESPHFSRIPGTLDDSSLQMKWHMVKHTTS
ncbi:hypothetical protein [Parasitella parasitica]|uniref:Uncharacterized protein n=1 Tax=Parasitella parasitica TaxID=35722 RepID=A0A0B7N1D5_9FUNG|nr:hypothetical protein [Parasitella parasitica]